MRNNVRHIIAKIEFFFLTNNCISNTNMDTEEKKSDVITEKNSPKTKTKTKKKLRKSKKKSKKKSSKEPPKPIKTLKQKQAEKSIKRVFEEYKNIVDCDIADIVMVDESVNCFYIRFTPKGGHYRNQTIILELKPKHPTHQFGYPYKPPLIRLLTPVFHTNVSSSGTICVDFIYNSHKWMPTYGFLSIVTAIILLFDEPEFTQGHYNAAASALYRKCRKEESFVEFDLKTKHYYNSFVSRKDNILDRFKDMYEDQHADRFPAGL